MLSIREGGKERHSKVIASRRSLEETFQECSMKRSRSCNQGVTTRSGLENDAGGRPLGEGEKEEMRCEIFHCLEESRFFQKKYMRVEVVKAVEDGPGLCEKMERASC